MSFPQIEEEKQKKREAGKEARAQKRKKEKESASKEAEPGAKKARQVKGRNHQSLWRLITFFNGLALTQLAAWFPQNEVKKRKEKQSATDRSSKKHLCSELNKVSEPKSALTC